MCFHDYHVKKGDGVLYNEKAGSGKTQKLYELVKQSDKCVVLSYTNKAVDNVKLGYKLLDMTRHRSTKCVILLIVISVVLVRLGVLIALKVNTSLLRSLI